MEKHAESLLSDTTNLDCSKTPYLAMKSGFDIPPPLVAIPKSPILSYSGSVSSSYDSNAENFLALFSDNIPSTPATICQEAIPESPHPDQYEDLEELWRSEENASFLPTDSGHMEESHDGGTEELSISSQFSEFLAPKSASSTTNSKENRRKAIFQPKQENWIVRNQPLWRVGLSKRTKVDPLHAKLKRKST